MFAIFVGLQLGVMAGNGVGVRCALFWQKVMSFVVFLVVQVWQIAVSSAYTSSSLFFSSAKVS